MAEGVYRRRDRWVAVVALPKDPATGKRRQLWLSAATEREAIRARRKALAELDAGTRAAPSRETLAGFTARWLADRKHRVTPCTLEVYASHSRALLAVLGTKRLDSLGPADVAGYCTRQLDAGLSARTVHHHYFLLKRILQTAVRWNVTARNPADAVDPPRVPRRHPAILSPEETRRLIEAARGRRLYLPVLLALSTGMRRGEIGGLHWKDVDLDAGTLTVAYSLEQTRGSMRLKEPKSGAGHRTLTLPALVVEALAEHRADQAQRRLLLGSAWQEQGLVYPGPFGRPMTMGWVSRAYRMLRDSLGLPAVTFHGLRHSSLSLLLSSGMPLPAVSRRAGHSSPALTAAIYAHARDAEDAQAVAIMDAVLGGAR